MIVMMLMMVMLMIMVLVLLQFALGCILKLWLPWVTQSWTGWCESYATTHNRRHIFHTRSDDLLCGTVSQRYVFIASLKQI